MMQLAKGFGSKRVGDGKLRELMATKEEITGATEILVDVFEKQLKVSYILFMVFIFRFYFLQNVRRYLKRM